MQDRSPPPGRTPVATHGRHRPSTVGQPPTAEIFGDRLEQPVSAMCGRLRLAREILTSRCWSVPPCVRPVAAVHMTAGHNALLGSGPGQLPAFDDAVALVGCPDRRIDRLCITCCSPSPTFTSRRMSTRSHSRRKCDRFSIAFAPGHHGPSYSGDLVGESDRGNLDRPPRQQCGEPRSVSDTMDLGITNDCECTRCEQAT